MTRTAEELFELTEEQREIQALCREFAAQEIRPISLAVDEADTEMPLGDLVQGGGSSGSRRSCSPRSTGAAA